MSMEKIMHSLTRATSAKLYIGSFLAGTLGGLSFAPLYWWPLFSLSLLLWFHLVRKLTNRARFLSFFCWSWGLFTVSFYWISLSFQVEIEKFWYLWPLGLLGIPALLAFTHLLVLSLITYTLQLKTSVSHRFFLAFLLSWGLAEWIRGHWLFGGFPWNFLGHIWGHNLFLLQSAAIVGDLGLSLATLCFLALPMMWLNTGFSGRARLMWTVLGTLTLFLLGFWGKQRIQPVTYFEKPWLRLVQPNIKQEDKIRPGHAKKTLEILKELTERPSTKPLTHILWPEVALPFSYTQNSIPYTLPIGKNQTLITGFMRRKGEHVFNALALIQEQGNIIDTYEKCHLVPFGEYIPGKQNLLFLGNIGALTLDRQDFTPGPGQRTILLSDLPAFSPLICFDTAFGGQVTYPTQRPDWLLELTNDAWFKDSWGLDQHMDLGRFRAVEEGLPLVRVTNTGISAVISPYGQVLHRLPIQKAGILDFALPHPLAPTPFSWLGYTLFWLVLALLAGILSWQTFGGSQITQHKKKRTPSRTPKKKSKA